MASSDQSNGHERQSDQRSGRAVKQAHLREWTSGFFDGEGYVRTSISKHDDMAVGYQAKPDIAIKHTYVGGLIDAEGSVAVGIGENDRYSVGHTAQAMVRVAMNDKDRLLDRLNAYADSIGVSCSNSHNAGGENRADTFVWRVSNIDDVERFCESIRDDVVVKRPEVEILLNRIIPLFRAGENKNRRGFLKIVSWRDVMDMNKGGERGKYTLEYFEDLWDMSLERADLPENHPKSEGENYE